MGKKPYTHACIINPKTGRAVTSTSALGRRLIRAAGYTAGAFLPSKQPGYKGKRGYKKGAAPSVPSPPPQPSRKRKAETVSGGVQKRTKLSKASLKRKIKAELGSRKKVKLSNVSGGKRKRGQFKSGLPSGSDRRPAPADYMRSGYTEI